MAIDWLDVGFNLVIGLVALAILCSIGFNIRKMIKKQIKEMKGDDEDELPRL